MALRRHVIAVRNTTKDAMAQALANAQTSEIEEANGWCWAMASVWTTGAGDLLDAVGASEGPALLVTTQDGCRWWFHLTHKGKERFSTFHDFTLIGADGGDVEYDDDWQDIYGDEDDDEDEGGPIIEIGPPSLPKARLEPLEFEDDFFEPYADAELEEEDDEEDEDYDESLLGMLLEDYEDMGAPLPDSIVDALEDAADEELMPGFLALHAQYIANALHAYGVPHDREAVVRILTGDGVTASELESDAGNLWRFLAELGLGQKFEAAVAEMEAAGSDDEEEDYDPAAEVLKATAGLTMHPVAGGPAGVPVEDGTFLCRIADGLNDMAEFAFAVRFDTDTAFWPRERLPSYALPSPLPDGVAIGFDAPNVLFAPKARARIGRLLASLPAGAALELAASGERQKYRFSGTVQNGIWHIDSASVPLTADEISELVTLFRTAEQREPFTARDDAEAEAVMDAASRDMALYDALPVRDGLSIRCTAAGNPFAIAALFFRQRFRHRWNMAPIEKRLDDNFRDWIKIEAQMNREAALPATDTVVFSGKASRFLEPDYNAPSVDAALRKRATDTTALDGAFRALGFECLGVVVCEKIGGGFLRCFANEAERTYAVTYFAPYMPTWHDFVSLLDDNTVFTTTSSAMESSIRSLRILIRQCPDGDVASMHSEHQTGLARLQAHGMEPRPIDSSLEGVARAMDAFLVRRLGTEED